MRPRPKKSSAHAASNATRRILRQCHFATPYGSPMALRAIRLVLRLWLPSGDAIRLRRTAMLALPAATRRAYAVPARYALVACGNVASIRALFSPMAPLWGRHTAPPHGYVLVACGNAANICRALLIACSPRFVAGTNGSGIRGVVQIVP